MGSNDTASADLGLPANRKQVYIDPSAVAKNPVPAETLPASLSPTATAPSKSHLETQEATSASNHGPTRPKLIKGSSSAAASSFPGFGSLARTSSRRSNVSFTSQYATQYYDPNPYGSQDRKTSKTGSTVTGDDSDKGGNNGTNQAQAPPAAVSAHDLPSTSVLTGMNTGQGVSGSGTLRYQGGAALSDHGSRTRFGKSSRRRSQSRLATSSISPVDASGGYAEEGERQLELGKSSIKIDDTPEKTTNTRNNKTVSATEDGIESDTATDATVVGGDSRSGSQSETGEEKEEGDLSEEEKREKELYDRFTPRKKNWIVAVVAYAALLAPFSSSSFLPSIPQIVEDLHTTASILNVTVAIFIITIGVFPLLWAPYCGIYGRKPIYCLSLPIFTLGSLGVALSKNLTSLILTRIIQGAGSSAVLSVGAGTIGDLYPRHERGSAMGFFYLGILVGPALAPALAGVLTEYVKPYGSGWRAMQYLLFAMGVLASLLVCLYLPETSHTRGIDRIRVERKEERGKAKREGRRCEVNSTTSEKAMKEDGSSEGGKLANENETIDVDDDDDNHDRWIWVWMNPLRPLKMLMHPHILAMSLNSSFVLMSTYTILVPLGAVLAPRYDINNAAILGLFYLCQGLGNAIATVFTGKYADYVLASWGRKRKGLYVPEDRLRATLLGGGAILPLAVLSLGWVLEKARGHAAIAGAVILLLVDGMGLMMVLTPSNTYCVDVMQNRSAEVIAVNNCLRYLFSAAASAFVLPLIEKIGVGWTNTLAAGIVWVGFGLVLTTIRFGKRMRAAGERWEGTANEGGDLEVKSHAPDRDFEK